MSLKFMINYKILYFFNWLNYFYLMIVLYFQDKLHRILYFFKSLCKNFKHHLKTQIEYIYITTIT